MLARYVFDGSVFYRLGRWRRAALKREDDLSDFDLFALLNSNFLDYSSHGGWNLDDSFVSFELHHWLAVRDFGARRNHQPHEVALFDVLAKFWQPEFRGSRRRRRRFAALDLGLRRLCRFLLRCLKLRWLRSSNFRLRSLSSCPGSVLNREDNLADFNFFSFFDANVFYSAAHGRGNLDHRFVGF